MSLRSLRLRVRGVLVVASALAVAGVVGAHIRLHNPGNLNPLFWPIPGNISIVTNSTGSDDIPDGSHETSIRSAYRTWNDVGAGAQLVEDTSTVSQARTDWTSSGIHLVLFDESNTSGFFPGGSGIVAITPVFFFSSGAIADADILFNGSQFTFSTDASSPAMDVEDVVTHELGHLLGLDHTGVVGGTMYPFVSGSVIAHRSLSQDEISGLRQAYPNGATGTISGTVLRLSDSSAVAGAWVVARDADGRTTSGDLTNTSGNFSIEGLPDGTYDVYATPLDAPVSAGNLTSGHTIETDFEPATYGSTAVVSGAGSVAMGSLFVDADVSLNLGLSGDALPFTGIADGLTRSVSVRGSGLVAGTTLTASDPDLVVTPTAFFGSQMQFNLTVPIGQEPGHVDLTAVNVGGDVAILPGAIEIVPPTPTITNVAPSMGQAAGGTALTITGTNFRAGSRVVVGDRIYVDGDTGGSTVVNPTTITLTTAQTVAGLHDVVVVDPTGVEARDANAYTAADLPQIDTTFPAVGSSAGGAAVTVRGQNFQAGALVRIDGVAQPSVTVVDTETIRFTAEPGVAGGPYTLEVQVGASIATSAFTYVAQADPTVSTITPATGTSAGGSVVRITGSGFTANTTVEFGAVEDTGAGGSAAAGVVLVDANNLDVTTPAMAAGATNVLVRDTGTGQASVVTAGFSFVGRQNDGGGGGCHVAPGATPGPRDALHSTAWLALLLGYAAWRGRRAAPVPVRR